MIPRELIYLVFCVILSISVIIGERYEKKIRPESLLKNKDAAPDYKIQLSLKEPRQVIKSPNFPNENYPPNTQILYEIEMQIDDEIQLMSSKIMLTFQFFELENSPFCTADGVEISESLGQDKVYCGSNVGKALLSKSSKLQIRFFSNSVIESRGFSIVAEIYNTECSKTFKGVSSGTFSSPNFPRNYNADDMCAWKIEAPKGKLIRVNFSETFDIPASEPLCVQDHLDVSLTGNFTTHVKRFCRSNSPSSLVSFGNTMLFKFHTDCCFVGQGFQATFDIISAEDVPTTPEPEHRQQICDCGKENIEETERIMGGKEVHPQNRYPWVVGFVGMNNGKPETFCGGALISRQYVLTAAHCFIGQNVSTFRLAIGAHYSGSRSTLIEASEIMQHPKFDADVFADDIALVKLKKPVTLGPTVGIICLPPYCGFFTSGDFATVAGWGYEKFENGSVSNELKEIELPIVSNAECVAKYGGVIQDTNICAGGYEGKDACSGDSGGPLFGKYEGKYYLIGVVSWGPGCGVKDHPGIYSRVADYLDFIGKEIIKSPSCIEDNPQSPFTPNLENCGIPHLQSEGSSLEGESGSVELPWIVTIVTDNEIVGIGVLVNPEYVLTSASLFKHWNKKYPQNHQPDSLYVIHGNRIANGQDFMSRIFSVKEIRLPMDNVMEGLNDKPLAFLKLSKTVEEPFRPICLPKEDASFQPGTTLMMAGFEKNKEILGMSSEVLLTNMTVKSKERCKKIFPQRFTDNLICANNDGKDACKGNIGAPLMKQHDRRYYLAGILESTDEECDSPDLPRVFSMIQQDFENFQK